MVHGRLVLLTLLLMRVSAQEMGLKHNMRPLADRTATPAATPTRSQSHWATRSNGPGVALVPALAVAFLAALGGAIALVALLMVLIPKCVRMKEVKDEEAYQMKYLTHR
jgi:hypothetical protein